MSDNTAALAKLERYDAIVSNVKSRTGGEIYHINPECPQLPSRPIGYDMASLQRRGFRKCRKCQVRDGEAEPYQTKSKDRSHIEALKAAANTDT